MSRKYHLLCLLIILLSFLPNNLAAQTVPPPLKNVRIQARVVLDGDGIYHYYHTVTNPTENKIGIGDFNIDITVPDYGISPNYIEKNGYAEPDSFGLVSSRGRGIPVAWKNTSPWKGAQAYEDFRWSLIGRADVMSWRAEYDFKTNHRYLLNPGETSEELETISYGLPGIRRVVFKPIWWALNLPKDFFINEEGNDQAFIINKQREEALGCVGTTIGPTAPPAFTPLQFNQMLQEYVSQCITSGWLKDTALAQQLNNYLIRDTAALKENRLADVQSIIAQFMNAVQNSSLNQRSNEAYALLYYNAKYFSQQNKKDLPVIIEITPNVEKHCLNEIHTTKVKVMRGYTPAGNFPLTARVVSGPNIGLIWRGKSDIDGSWSFSYKSENIGMDTIRLVREVSDIVSSDAILWQPFQSPESHPIRIIWKCGSDLMLNDFFPPMIAIPFARPTIPLEESTINIGDAPAPPSVTRCYLTKEQQISPNDLVLSERQVPALAVKEISEYKAAIPVPRNLEQGMYYIYCCADANKEIIELVEENNCHALVVQIGVPVLSAPKKTKQ